MAEVKKKTIPTTMNFILGGSAGMMAMAIVQPNDLTKTRMQLQGAKARISTLAMMSKILKDEGILGFYNGLSAALFRQATYTTTRMGIFNSLLNQYKTQYGTAPNMAVKMGIGCVSGGAGAFVGTPAEVALIRMTADGRLPPEKRRNYKHVFNALIRIVKEEGITGLWTGATPTVTRAMIVNALQLGSYAECRERLLPTFGDNLTLHFCSSMIAGLVTTAGSLPVDIIKTRVQNASEHISQVKALSNLVTNEGVSALWKGFLPTYLKIGPHTILTFIFLEQLNKFYLENIA